jgi:GTP-binding protein
VLTSTPGVRRPPVSQCAPIGGRSLSDIDVNAIKEKQQTNVRAASADQLIRLVPAKRLSLEEAIEFIREDESVEITPESVRPRKVLLERTGRVKAARQAARVV